MPSVCPRPCSRLATAAVFLSVGVVQFVVGIVLLRSKFVYMLAGPDFWTSSCNVAVGCLLGVSASIWGHSKKRTSKKHVTRKRLLLALVSSALLMNVTTLIILLLGEGNALLSIRLESHGNTDEMALAGELLAYAYVTSVCCPVVCIVVSIVSMSGSCFSVSGKNPLERRFSLGSFKKRKSESLQWVYATENRDLPKSNPRDFVSSSSSGESENDLEEMRQQMRQKHSNSIEELQNVLGRMAHGNRDSILRDSALMLRQLDLRRQNRINSLNQDGSYIGPSLMRMKEFSASERTPSIALNEFNDSGSSKIFNPKRYSSELGESSRLAPDGSKLLPYSRSEKPDTEYRNPYSNAKYRDSSKTREIIYSSHQRNYGGEILTKPLMNDRESNISSYIPDYDVNRDVIFSHKAFKPTPEIEYSRKLASEEHICDREEESLNEISAREIKRRYYETSKTKERPHYDITKTKERAPYETTKTKDGLCYEISEMKEGPRQETSKARERSLYETNKAKERSRYEISEMKEGPCQETSKARERSLYEANKAKERSCYETSETKDGSSYGTSKSQEGSSFGISRTKERSPDVNECFSPEGSEFSEDSILDSSRSPWAGEMISISFKNPSVARLSEKLIPVASPMIPSVVHQDLDLPKMSDDSGIFSVQSTSFSSDAASQDDLNIKDRKVSSFRENSKGSQEFPKAGSQGIKKYDLSRVVTMASISEEPNLDGNGPDPKSPNLSHCSGEETPKLSLESRRVSLPSMFLDSKNTRRQYEESEGNYSPRKKSLSTKSLKKLLSSVTLPSNQPHFLDQVVDNDSLIGLSEEELIARQLRTRSIRKTVQQRIKDEMTV